MRTQLVRIICKADDDVFSENWDDISEGNRKIIKENYGIPCGGEATVGVICLSCPFSDYENEED
jgi:hypothetical protein